MQKIFVSIACFMDNDIVNTIEDCLKKAKHPDNIVFGICLQSDENDTCLDKYANHPQFRIHKMHWKEAKGPMYARFFCQQLLEDEEYFLQIDCHTRFFEDWDTIIIKELGRCEEITPKAVISHYPLNIKRMEQEKDKHIGHIATYREINRKAIKSHGSLHKIPDTPLKSFGIMAAMVFTRGRTIKEVPYDMKTYHGYHSEEQFFYSARLWTHGYDCFTPTVHVLAMEYETNRARVASKGKAHLAIEGNKWNQVTWRKCKYYLKLDTLENVDCQEYKDDILRNQNRLGLGNQRHIVDYYKYTGLHRKLCDIFPFYENYQRLKWHDTITHSMELFNGGQKIAVVTQNTPNLIESYFRNTRDNHIMYCRKHNYAYYAFYENLAEDVKYGESPKICWSKVKACLNVIKNHDYIMWVDADTIFANQSIRIQDVIDKHPDRHFYLTDDPKSPFINSGVMLWKNSDVAVEVLKKWWGQTHTSYGKGGDQKQLGNMLRGNPTYAGRWHHCSEREMNCYPTNYRPYDYIIHYMGIKSKIGINDRVIRWNKFLKHEHEKPLVYVSVAVTPIRIPGLVMLVDNLMSSTVKPDKIVLNVPKRYRLFDSSDHIEKINKKLSEHIASGLVHLNVLSVDYGPCNKWQGMVQYCEANNLMDRNFVSIVIDDDLLYHDYVIEESLKEHFKHNRSVITGYNNFTRHGNNIRTSVDGVEVLLLKGGNLTLLPKYFFVVNLNPTFEETLVNALNSDYRDCIFSDDHIITAFLHKKRINIISIFDAIRSRKHHRAYRPNPICLENQQNGADEGLSDPGKKPYDRAHASHFNAHFSAHYQFKKYSNVEFVA